MKLIDLLLLELPKQGGWPRGYDCISTNGYNQVWAYKTKGGVMGKDLHLYSSEEGNVTREQYESALAAIRPEWDGGGLPTVGCEFEHSFHANGFSSWHWRKCTAVGKHGVLCVDENDTELYLNDTNNKFRPAKTESDKKRDISVNEMIEVYRNALGSPFNAMGELYDAIAAGKIPGIRID